MPGVFGWLYNYTTEEWERAPSRVSTLRLVAVGPVAAGAHKLYWIKCNPAAVNAAWELTDAIAALGAVVLDTFHASRDGHTVSLGPPMQFDTGIYLETIANMTSMTFGYV